MLAERIKFEPLPQPRYQTLTALFACEADGDDFIARLGVLDVTPQAISIIGVSLGEPPKRVTATLNGKPPNLAPYTRKGAAIGIGFAFFLGLLLYSTNFLQLTLLEALFIHTFALVILGGVIGGATGAILASIQAQEDITTIPPQNTEGVLVTVKLPSHLFPQGEAIARESGAQKVIS